MSSIGRLAILGVLVATAAAVLGARYEVVQAIDDRLGTSITIGAARFAPPGLLEWPRLTQDGALSSCDLCADGIPASQITKEYGVLVGDDALNDLGNIGSRRPPSGAAVPLPRLAWILQWPPTCSEFTARHSEKCATYELIDDATGWVLDSGQILPP
jgi:hypothetical protein